MVVDFTRITDGMNRPVQVVGETATVTSCIGLLPLMHFVRVSGIYDILQRLISPTLPTCKCRGGRTQFNKFLQRLGGLFIGKEDLIDHDSIGRDPGFMAAMGLPATAGSSCLCRFENMIGEPTIQAMQKVLRQIFLAGFYGRKPDFLWVDIDCTPIYVYGNQENKEYSGHYGDYCLMALVVFVNHYPVWVELDGGCTDGRKMLEKIYLEVISFLKQHFPNTPIAFRADSGFMREDILKELEKQEVLYFIGFAPNCVITKYADNEWKPEVLKAFERDSDHELVLRALGEYREYLPKKWKRDDHPHARLILRDQYAPKPKITRKQRSNPEKEMECDLRCILTNLPRKDNGKCGQLWRADCRAIYEDLYCRRGSACELKFHELKAESKAARASANRFRTNFYRVLLASICYSIFVSIRLSRFMRFEADGKWWTVTVKRMRNTLINIPGLIAVMTRCVRLVLPSELPNRKAFLHFWPYKT